MRSRPLVVFTPVSCWSCGEVLNASLNHAEPPAPGDWNVCGYCHALGVFTATGVRPPAPEELAAAAVDPSVQDALALLLPGL